MIQTVTGEINPEKLGCTMAHEHLALRKSRAERENGESYINFNNQEILMKQLKQLKENGIDTIIDCTPIIEERKVQVLPELSEKSGINIICSTGYYKESKLPAAAYSLTETELAEKMIKEIEQGIEHTGIKAGMIKLGVSREEITPREKRVIRAGIRAHAETDTPVTIHITLGEMGMEVLKMLENSEVKPGKFVFAHSDLNTSFSYHESLVKQGVNLGFDTIGKEKFDYVRRETAGKNRFEFEKEAYNIPDIVRARSIEKLVEAGYEDKIVLSSDILRKEAYFNPETLGVYGYSYLQEKFIPYLRENFAVDSPAINKMLTENPAKLFS